MKNAKIYDLVIITRNKNHYRRLHPFNVKRLMSRDNWGAVKIEKFVWSQKEQKQCPTSFFFSKWEERANQ